MIQGSFLFIQIHLHSERKEQQSKFLADKKRKEEQFRQKAVFEEMRKQIAAADAAGNVN